MKLKDLRQKEVGELRSLLDEVTKELPKLRMELAMKKDKNVKKYANKRRDLAVLSGLISSKKESK